MIKILGPVVVLVPGTLVRASATVLPPDDLTRYKVHAVLMQARPTNVGKVYIGDATLNRATLAGVATVLAIPTATALPAFSIAHTISPAGVDLSDLWLDADTAGDGVLITVLVT